MTNRIQTFIALPLLTLALAGCGGSGARTAPAESVAAIPPAPAEESWSAAGFDAVTPQATDDSVWSRTSRLDLIDVWGDRMGGTLGGSAGTIDGTTSMRVVTASEVGGCFQPAISRDGQLVAFASTQHATTADIYIKQNGGRTQRQLTRDPADDMMPTFSPDGAFVAFASNRHGDWNIYLMPTEGGAARQVTEDADDEIHPSFSPNGDQLVYCRRATRSGRWEIWTVDLATTQQQFLGYGLFPEWSPDPSPSRIVFQRARQRGSRLFSVWTLDVIDGEPANETEIVSASNAATMHPTWSPDGRRIAFVTVVDPDLAAGEPMTSDVYVIDRDGRNRANLTRSDALHLFPAWSADGSVYFVSDRSGNLNVFALHGGAAPEPGMSDPTPMRTADAEPSGFEP